MSDKPCHLCERGFPMQGQDHIPTQSLGMIPVMRCLSLITRAEITRFRKVLNARHASTPNHRNGRFQQKTRPYGDYLLNQDREKFMCELAEWLPQQKTNPVKP
jgi:hypothetical protein